MKSNQILITVVRYLLQISGCALVYVVGIVIGSTMLLALGTDIPPAAETAADTRAGVFIVSTLGIKDFHMPNLADEGISVLYLVIGSIALAIGLAPLARRLRGVYWMRWLILGAFMFFSLGVNNAIETLIFFSAKGALLLIPIYFWPCVLCAGAVTFLFKPLHEGDSISATASRFFAGCTLDQWIWRFFAAIVSFPLAYLVCGLIVSPIVLEYYKDVALGLVIPDMGVILSAQFIRSVLFLLASIPILIVWSGNRLQLIMLLGVAFFLFMGIAVTYWFPPILRVTHSIEVLAGSLIYAWLLVKLLVQKKAQG